MPYSFQQGLGQARPNKKLSQRGKNFQELKICGHGTILALTFFAAFRNFRISLCSQIVDKLRLTRYYKGKSNTRQGGATMTAVIYARYSSDSQREASIEGQLRDCKDYAEKNGITVVGTYIDRAYSAMPISILSTIMPSGPCEMGSMADTRWTPFFSSWYL